MTRCLPVLSLFVAACSNPAPVATPPPPPDPEIVLAASTPFTTQSFSSSEECVICHSGAPEATAMRDLQGADISPFQLWQSTMMANSARDPLFRAALSAEVAATPSRAPEIEDSCLSCHAPLLSANREIEKASPPALADLYAGDRDAQLGLEGVSCTLCHQITERDLGQPASFTGRYSLALSGQLFGPHKDPFAMPMWRHSSYEPIYGAQMRDSGLCATCHTLYSDALDPSGKPTGHRLPEQTPFLEWRNSSFAASERSPGVPCQDCHMPNRDEAGRPLEAAIARSPHGGDFDPVGPRSPYGRHVFVGGNTLVPAMLRDHRNELNPRAPDAAFDATIAAARTQLEQRTARVEILEAARTGEVVSARVAVRPSTGHKLPTGHPARRAWLRVRLTDAGGRTLTASGAFDERGRLLNADGEVHAAERRGGPVFTHQQTITSADSPLVYESVMADAAGRPTWRLLRGATYTKDNRLLPRGWEPEHPDARDTTPQGLAGDADFVGGCDEVAIRLEDISNDGPLTLEVSLYYQPLGSRYADELFAFDTPEVQDLRRYYEAADLAPELLARDERTF